MSSAWLLGALIGLTFLAAMVISYPLRRYIWACCGLVCVIFIMAFAGYFYWGDFNSWHEFMQHQNSQQQAQAMLKTIKSPQELIDKLRSKLDNSPQSAKGWYLLGRLYASQDDKQEAVNAFKKAHRLNPKDEQYSVNYAHSLWQLNNQQFTKQILDIFQELLKTNPKQPDALAMLAMAAFMNHDYEDAIAYWQRLLPLAAPQSEEAQTIRKAIVKAEERLKLKAKD